jgi:hypothetical protein
MVRTMTNGVGAPRAKGIQGEGKKEKKEEKKGQNENGSHITISLALVSILLFSEFFNANT